MTTKTATASYRKISGPDGLLANLKPFKGNTMSARFEGDTYVVYSYRTPIAWAYPNGVNAFDETHYSVTTSKHQGYARAWLSHNH